MSGEINPEFSTEISFADDSFVDLGLHVTQATVLQLVHIQGDEIRPLGSCFAITNSGLCMTARHVVEEGLGLTDAAPGFMQLDAEKHGSFAALFVSSEPHPDDENGILGGLLPVHRTWMIGGIDIALVMLNLPIDTRTGEKIRFPAHQLRLSTPGVGETFFGLGYRGMTWTAKSGPEDYLVDHRYSATKGEVEELHLGGRDGVMLPFPCFRTSARLDGGMSGGPLIDYSGRVFGVVCSSYGLGEENDGHISYGSVIAPSMLMTVDVTDPDGTERRAFLWELVEGGAIKADTRGISVSRTGDNLAITMGQGLKINSNLDS